jgi:hypothetical protein
VRRDLKTNLGWRQHQRQDDQDNRIGLGEKPKNPLTCGGSVSDHMVKELSQFQWCSLKILTLCSNPLSNKSIKIILKLELKALTCLDLGNTICTSDCLKILAKLVAPELYTLCFDGTKKIGNMILFRQLMKLLDAKKHQNVRLLLTWLKSVSYGQEEYYYLGHLAKISCKEGVLNKIQIFPNL